MTWFVVAFAWPVAAETVGPPVVTPPASDPAWHQMLQPAVATSSSVAVPGFGFVELRVARPADQVTMSFLHDAPDADVPVMSPTERVFPTANVFFGAELDAGRWAIGIAHGFASLLDGTD